MQYVDSSALLRRYVQESDSARAIAMLTADPDWVTGRHTYVEVRRNLVRLLPVGPDRSLAQAAFTRDWERCSVVELDEQTTESASAIAESTGARTLDALHLAAALRTCGPGGILLTFDIRMAHAAQAIGLSPVGI